MRVEFENSKRQRRVIGEFQTREELSNIIKQFLDDHNFKSYYTRTWYDEETDEMWIDVGSHTEFFIVPEAGFNFFIYEEKNNED